MKKKEVLAQRVADALDVPLDVLCDVPRIEMVGKSSIRIENFRGILDYTETRLTVNTNAGILEIDGSNIFIESITDEDLTLKGELNGLFFS